MNESAMSRYRHSVHAGLTMGLHYSLAACLLAAFSIGLAQAQQPDYNMLDEILARNVRNGFVDYDGIAAEPQLSKVIERFGDKQSADISSFNSKLAFYINAYNTLAIQGILDGQSPSSWWGRRKFFNQQQFNVLGETINLHELEHEHIITLSEPRIHFAIVCASISCPRLSSRAYRAKSLDLQLHEAAVKFINDPARNRFDPERRIAFLSKIFTWYEDDFVAAGGSLQRYLARFVADAPTQDMLRKNEFEIRFMEYDWNLNGRYKGKD